MKILGIETSCDETAISIIEVIDSKVSGTTRTTDTPAGAPKFLELSSVLISQTDVHEQYGGVFPMIAKREHAKNLTPLLHKALGEAGFIQEDNGHAGRRGLPVSDKKRGEIREILAREHGLFEQLITFLENTSIAIDDAKHIDAIAVTSGPGLEPALWVGLSFAKALGIAWNIPVVPVNHMEGHVVGALFQKSDNSTNSHEELKPVAFPALALLISGGHTELVLMNGWRSYQLIGKTRDDAVGEAFDKVARLLGLPYPGGPNISRLAEAQRASCALQKFADEKKAHGYKPVRLPRPMIHSADFDFSFSGLKTAVLYLIKKEYPILTDSDRQKIACEFEDAITEVLITKTEAAVERYNIETLIIGGGVIANTHVRRSFEKLASDRDLRLYLPSAALTTDNALMIAIAGYFVFASTHSKGASAAEQELRANGNLSL